uniref:Uncharacterized protein n=1 Tax=Avena sativa TaxID=4498 RepID=A0ACD5ZF60_AVESA
MPMGEEDAFATYEALASSFPTCRGLRRPYRKYGNFIYPAHLMAPTLAMRDAFVARPTDVLLATMPKSGTTWLKALVFAVTHRGCHAPDDERHPLLCSSPHDLVPFLHTLYQNHHPEYPPSSCLEEMPPPRILAVHAPFSLLQESSVAESRCRIVYLCRDPKDALVSFWHFIDKAAPPSSTASLAFPEAFELFCDGVFPFGPIWDHMAEYWKESVARPDEVMFLRYEHLKEDTLGSVKQLAEFLGCPFTVEEVAGGVPEAVVALCSMDQMRDVRANRDGEHGVSWKFKNSAFFRKGEVGDWNELMTPEMARRIDATVEEKLRGSGLSLIRN